MVIGEYQVTSRLGRGASGVVYQATHPVHGPVAIKIMHAELAEESSARTRFAREVEALARLRHRNVVTLFEANVEHDPPFIAMELLPGETLAARLATGERFTVDRALDIIIQICDGLQFAHERGIIHRDVKPANIWLLPNMGVKLLDFGLARIAGSTVTVAGDVLGSAAYMAPEQFSGGHVDGRADVFAAGAILYQLLTGRRAFNGEGIPAVTHQILYEPVTPIGSLVDGVSDEICVAVHTALEKDPGRRYPQAGDFSSDLRLARYGIDSDSPPPAVSSEPQSEAPSAESEAPTVGTGTRVLRSAAGRSVETEAPSATADTVMPGDKPAAPMPSHTPDVPAARHRAGVRPWVLGVAIGAVALVLAVVGYQQFSRGEAAVPMATVVLDALPWARIVEVRGSDQRAFPLPADAATPMALKLPVGSYTIVLIGPPPAEERREVVVMAQTQGRIASPPEVFRVVAAEDYLLRAVNPSGESR